MRSYIVRSRGPTRGRASRSSLALAIAALWGSAPLAPQLAGQAATSDDPPLRVAVVQLDAVALQSPAGQRLQAELLAFQEDFTSELRTRQSAAGDIERRVAEADSLTADQRRALEREYQDLVTQLQRFQQDKQEEANLMRAEGLAAIQQQIGPVLEALQAENGYDLILNAQNDLIVIFSERVDITPLVLARLQSEGGTGS